jgi:hypothetical protein
MKKLILLLLLIPTFMLAQPKIEVDEIWTKTFSLDSNTYTDEFFFRTSGDSLAFQVEVVSASLGNTSPAGDSLNITLRMLPVSQTLLRDTTSYTYWTNVLSKTAPQGRVAFGNNISLPLSKQVSAVGRVSVTNAKGTRQSVTVKIYAIRKWR